MLTMSKASRDWLVAQYEKEFHQYLEEVGLDALPRSGTFKTRLELEEAVGALLFFEDCEAKDWAPYIANDVKESPVAVMDYVGAFNTRMNHFYSSASSVSSLSNKRRHCRSNLVRKNLCLAWGLFDMDSQGYHIRKEDSYTGKAKYSLGSYFITPKAKGLFKQIGKSTKDRYNLENMVRGVTFQRGYKHPACPDKVFLTKNEAIRELEGYYDKTNKARNAARVRETLTYDGVVLNCGLDDVRQALVKNPINSTEIVVDNTDKWWVGEAPVLSVRIPVKRWRIRYAIRKRYAQVRKHELAQRTGFTHDNMMVGLEKMLYDLECSEDGRIQLDFYRDKHGRDYETNYWVQNFSSDIRSFLFSGSISVDLKSAMPSCLLWLVKEFGLDESEFTTLSQLAKDPDAFRALIAQPVIDHNYSRDNATKLAKSLVNYVTCGAKCDPSSIAYDIFYHTRNPKLSARATAFELGITDTNSILDAVQLPEFVAYSREVTTVANHIKDRHVDENNVHTNSLGLQNQLKRRKKGTIMSHEYQGLEARVRDAIYNYPFPTENGPVPLKDVPNAITCVVHDGFYIEPWAMSVINESGLTLEDHVKNVTGMEFTFTYEDTSDNPWEKEYQEWLASGADDDDDDSWLEEVRNYIGVKRP